MDITIHKEKTWHHLVRDDGSVSLYYTYLDDPAHYVVFDTSSPNPAHKLAKLLEGLRKLLEETEDTFYTMDTVEYVRREIKRLLKGGE